MPGQPEDAIRPSSQQANIFAMIQRRTGRKAVHTDGLLAAVGGHQTRRQSADTSLGLEGWGMGVGVYHLIRPGGGGWLGTCLHSLAIQAARG